MAKMTVRIHEKLNQSSLFIHANSRSTQCSNEASEEPTSSLAASRNYRSLYSLGKRQRCEECATMVRKLLLEHLSNSFEDTRHLQVHNVEFAFHNVEFAISQCWVHNGTETLIWECWVRVASSTWSVLWLRNTNRKRLQKQVQKTTW